MSSKKNVFSLGQYKNDCIQNITGGFKMYDMGGNANIPFGFEPYGAFSLTDLEYTSPKVTMNDDARTRRLVSFDASRNVRTSSVTRTKELGINYIIKY